MKTPTRRSCTVALLAGAFLASPLALGQDEAPASMPSPTDAPLQAGPPGSRWSASLDLSTYSLLNADFDSSTGDVSVVGAAADLGLSYRLSGTSRQDASMLSIGVRGGLRSYDFSDGALQPPTLGPMGPVEAWDEIVSMGLSVGYRGPLEGRYGFISGISIESEMETGATFEDSLTYGGIAGVTYQWDSSLVMGLGVGVRTRLEDDTRIIPLPIIIWQASDRVVVSTGGGAGGPGGGLAGLGGVGASVTYIIDEAWSVGVSVGFQSIEARLDDDPIAPDGVGRHTGIPILARVNWKLHDQATLTLAAGYVFGQEYELNNSDGNELIKEDAEGSLALGIGVSLQF